MSKVPGAEFYLSSTSLNTNCEKLTNVNIGKFQLQKYDIVVAGSPGIFSYIEKEDIKNAVNIVWGYHNLDTMVRAERIGEALISIAVSKQISPTKPRKNNGAEHIDVEPHTDATVVVGIYL